MLFLFVISMALGSILAPLFLSEGMQAFGSGNENNVLNPIIYIVILIVFSLIILYVAKRKKKRTIKWVFVLALGLTIIYVVAPLTGAIMFPDKDMTPHGHGDMITASDDGLYVISGSRITVLNGSTDDEINSTLAPSLVSHASASDAYLAVLLENKSAVIYDNDLNQLWQFPNITAVSAWSYGALVVNDTGIWKINASGPMLLSNLSFTHITGNGKGFAAWNDDTLALFSNDTLKGDKPAERNATDVRYATVGRFIGDGEDVAVLYRDRTFIIYDSKLHRTYKTTAPGDIRALHADDVDGDGSDDIILAGKDDVLVLFRGDGSWNEYYSLTGEYDVKEGITDVTGIEMAGYFKMFVVSDASIYSAKVAFNDPGPIIYVPWIVGLLVSVGLMYLLYKNPEWYVIDIVGVIVASGSIAIFGISLGILPTMVLLILLAIYDAISVYRTKHMIDLAGTVMDMRLPILLVVPKKKGYSFKKQPALKSDLKNKDRGAMFMGLGDVIIPTIMGVSAQTFLPDDTVLTILGMGIGGNILVELLSFMGAIIGYLGLMRFVMKGNPQAGLPMLNSGAILGYIIGYILVFGDLSLGITLMW